MGASERATHAQHWLKDQRASDRGSTSFLLRRAYEDAIVLQLAATQMRGYGSVFAAFLAALAIGTASFFPPLFWPMISETIGTGYWVPAVLLVTVITLTCVVCVMGALRIFRLDLFSPKEVPIVFNRATRKVCEFMPKPPVLEGIAPAKVLRYWAGNFKPWPMMLVEYDWDCMEAEFEVTRTMIGNVPKTLHQVRLYVKASPTSDEVVTLVSLMTPFMTGGEEGARRFWEHIRRFMEERGPHLSPGDAPAPPYPRTPLAAVRTVIPWIWPVVMGAFFWSLSVFIDHGLFRMTPLEFMGKSGVGHVPAVVFLMTVFPAFASLFNWIAHLVAPDVPMPPDVLQGAGKPLDMKQLASEAKRAAKAADPAAQVTEKTVEIRKD